MKRSKTEAKRYRPAGSSLQVTEESIAGYIAAIEKSGKSAGTIEEYRRNLHLLYNFLPENKRLRWPPNWTAATRRARSTHAFPRPTAIWLSAGGGIYSWRASCAWRNTRCPS